MAKTRVKLAGKPLVVGARYRFLHKRKGQFVATFLEYYTPDDVPSRDCQTVETFWRLRIDGNSADTLIRPALVTAVYHG